MGYIGGALFAAGLVCGAVAMLLLPVLVFTESVAVALIGLKALSLGFPLILIGGGLLFVSARND